MYTGILHTHKLVVTLFLLQYLVKTILLLLNKNESLEAYSKKTRIAEIIVSVLFLATGIYLAFNSGNNGTWLWVKLIGVLISIPLAIVGFKKKIKAMTLVSLLLIVYAYGVSETKSPFLKMSGKNKAGEFADVPADELGKKIYESRCVKCHGAEGNQGLSGAKDLGASMMTHEEKMRIIATGKNEMTSFKNDLTTSQIDAVASYVETLK